MSDTDKPNVTYNVVEQPTVKQQLVSAGIQIATPLVMVGGFFGAAAAYEKLSSYRARRAAKKAAQTESPE